MDVSSEIVTRISPTLASGIPNPSNDISEVDSAQPISTNGATEPRSTESDPIILIDDIPDETPETQFETKKSTSPQAPPKHDGSAELEITKESASEVVATLIQHSDDPTRDSNGEDVVTVYTGIASIPKH